MKIGVISTLYPTKRFPTFGNFVKDELDNLAKFCDIKLISPLPNQYWFGESHFSTADVGYSVMRPFVFAFPRWFIQKCHPSSMAVTLTRSGRKYFNGCELIHAHNAFPDGIAAVKAFGRDLPVIVTVHGSDVNLFAMKQKLQRDIVSAMNRAKRTTVV